MHMFVRRHGAALAVILLAGTAIPGHAQDTVAAQKALDSVTAWTSRAKAALVPTSPPVVTPPVTPPVVTPPTSPPATAGLIAREDFTTGWRTRHPDWEIGRSPELLQDVAGGGIKYNQPAGTAATPNVTIPLPNVSEFWLEVVTQWSPGYTTTGTLANSGNGYKFLSWGWAGYDVRGTVNVEHTDQYTLDGQVKARNGTVVSEFVYNSTGLRSTQHWAQGAAVRYHVHVVSRNGEIRQRLWVDGKLAGETRAPMSKGVAAPPIYAIRLGENFNQVRTRAQWLIHKSVTIYDGSKASNPFELTLP